MAGPWAGAVTCGESPGWVGYREAGLVPEALGAERWALEVQELGGASGGEDSRMGLGTCGWGLATWEHWRSGIIFLEWAQGLIVTQGREYKRGP